MVLILHDDRLFRSPLENPQSVLDIGTGTGNWAVYVMPLPSRSPELVR